MANLTDDLLSQYGGRSVNDLIDVLGQDTVDDNNIQLTYSPYISTDSLAEHLEGQRGKFTVFSINAQSINAKINELTSLLGELESHNFSFSALCIQETWLEHDADTSLLQIPGYTLISLGRTCSAHGGLIIYLQDKYTFHICDLYKGSDLWEGLFIEISGNNLKHPITLGNIYRPPRFNNNNITVQNFIDEINPVISRLGNNTHNVILVGDYNIDLLSLENRETYQQYLDMFISNSFFPKLTFPTRFSKTRGTLIDQIFCKLTSSTLKCHSGIILSNASDHLPYFTCIDSSPPPQKSPKFARINVYNESSIQSFINEIETSLVDSHFDNNIMGNPNSNYDKLESIIIKAKETYLPNKLVRFKKYKHKKHNWVTNAILKSIKFRDNLYKSMLLSKSDPESYETCRINLKAYNKILNKCIREAKANYYTSLFSKFKSDIRKTWQSINEILFKTKRPADIPTYLKLEDERIEDNLNIAIKFNDFFVNIGPTLSSKIKSKSGKSYQTYLKHTITHSFQFQTVTTEIVSKSIRKIASKSSSGHDGISTNLLQRINHVIAPTLTLIINQSLASGIFPNRLKIAKVIPLFKKGDIHIVDNYRPISLLPALSKVFEKIVFKQLYDYFLTKKLLYNSQYGFREGHSTEFASLEFIDRISQDLDQGKIPIALYLDLSKAFDTLDHSILLAKLKYYGVRNTELDWFNSYLNDRYQYVEINGSKSPQQRVTTGVPQGSILGPLLFIIYMNDLHIATRIFHSILYADDTTLQTPLCAFKIQLIPSEIENLSKSINSELSKIQEWLAINKLSLNISKTKYMLFHHKQKDVSHIELNLEINNTPLEKVSDFNFLGLIINENLTWQSHINKLSGKISRSLGVMNRLKRFLSSDVLRIIYNSMILPHLQFGILCWGCENSRLAKLQKRALRIICHSKYNAHTEPLFKASYLLKIDDIFTYFTLKFYHKLKNNTLPINLQRIFVNVSDQHDYATRQIHLLHRPLVKTSSATKVIRHYLPKIVSCTAPEIIAKISTHSYSGFSTYVKRHMLNKYGTSCELPNCYICNS